MFYQEVAWSPNLHLRARAEPVAISLPSVSVQELPEGAEGTLTFGPPQTPAKPEPTRTKIDDDGAEYEYVKVSGLTVQFTPTGKKVGKIKGGKYTKIGVTVWPEVLKSICKRKNIQVLE